MHQEQIPDGKQTSHQQQALPNIPPKSSEQTQKVASVHLQSGNYHGSHNGTVERRPSPQMLVSSVYMQNQNAVAQPIYPSQWDQHAYAQHGHGGNYYQPPIYQSHSQFYGYQQQKQHMNENMQAQNVQQQIRRGSNVSTNDKVSQQRHNSTPARHSNTIHAVNANGMQGTPQFMSNQIHLQNQHPNKFSNVQNKQNNSMEEADKNNLAKQSSNQQVGLNQKFQPPNKDGQKGQHPGQDFGPSQNQNQMAQPSNQDDQMNSKRNFSPTNATGQSQLRQGMFQQTPMNLFQDPMMQSQMMFQDPNQPMSPFTYLDIVQRYSREVSNLFDRLSQEMQLLMTRVTPQGNFQLLKNVPRVDQRSRSGSPQVTAQAQLNQMYRPQQQMNQGHFQQTQVPPPNYTQPVQNLQVDPTGRTQTPNVPVPQPPISQNVQDTINQIKKENNQQVVLRDIINGQYFVCTDQNQLQGYIQSGRYNVVPEVPTPTGENTKSIGQQKPDASKDTKELSEKPRRGRPPADKNNVQKVNIIKEEKKQSPPREEPHHANLPNHEQPIKYQVENEEDQNTTIYQQQINREVNNDDSRVIQSYMPQNPVSPQARQSDMYTNISAVGQQLNRNNWILNGITSPVHDGLNDIYDQIGTPLVPSQDYYHGAYQGRAPQPPYQEKTYEKHDEGSNGVQKKAKRKYVRRNKPVQYEKQEKLANNIEESHYSNQVNDFPFQSPRAHKIYSHNNGDVMQQLQNIQKKKPNEVVPIRTAIVKSEHEMKWSTNHEKSEIKRDTKHDKKYENYQEKKQEHSKEKIHSHSREKKLDHGQKSSNSPAQSREKKQEDQQKKSNTPANHKINQAIEVTPNPLDQNRHAHDSRKLKKRKHKKNKSKHSVNENDEEADFITGEIEKFQKKEVELEKMNKIDEKNRAQTQLPQAQSSILTELQNQPEMGSPVYNDQNVNNVQDYGSPVYNEVAPQQNPQPEQKDPQLEQKEVDPPKVNEEAQQDPNFQIVEPVGPGSNDNMQGIIQNYNYHDGNQNYNYGLESQHGDSVYKVYNMQSPSPHEAQKQGSSAYPQAPTPKHTPKLTPKLTPAPQVSNKQKSPCYKAPSSKGTEKAAENTNPSGIENVTENKAIDHQKMLLAETGFKTHSPRSPQSQNRKSKNKNTWAGEQPEMVWGQESQRIPNMQSPTHSNRSKSKTSKNASKSQMNM